METAQPAGQSASNRSRSLHLAGMRLVRRERLRVTAAPSLLVKVLAALVMGALAVPTVAIVIALLPLFIVGAIVAGFLGALVGIFLRTARSF